jgi:RsiW-degrading membrane proteinase PrsW (M82 family)
MTWTSYLRSKSHDPPFLWRMVIVILAVGVAIGLAADGLTTTHAAAETSPRNDVVDQLDALAAGGQWMQLWRGIPELYAWRYATVGLMALAGVAGACWLAFLLHVAQVERHRGRLVACLVGVALGVLSIWPTVFFIYWQEYRWNLRESVELAPGLRFFVLGVGLREEVSKLVCLLPLMPWLVAKRDELGALIASACVGLGFAVEENLGYFWASDGRDVLGRLLTANPFHLAITGVVGLALYRAIVWPREWGPQFLAVFGVAVLAHGLYDAFISIEALQDLALFTTILFALVVYQFFRELRGLRSPQRGGFSLTATFLCGVSLVTAATFIYLCSTVGATDAFDMLAVSVIDLSIMVYLFLREMPDTMVSV